MRLVRLAEQPSRVSEDIRAALASLGRGNTVVGGVSLIGVKLFDDAHTVDAVVILPRGILLVIGVDLPDPAMRLEAPLEGQWKADGWPLIVQGDDAVNPATKALAFSTLIATKLIEAHPMAGTVGTVVAVGPYVETVDQPPADLAGTVRVLHPTPTSMLAATISLATAKRPRTTDEARALLKTLAPDAAELSDELLIAEGFRPGGDEPTIVTAYPLLAATPTVPAEHPPRAAEKPKTPLASLTPPPAPIRVPVVAGRAPAPSAPPPPSPAPASPAAPPPARKPKSPPKTGAVRWLPFAAVGLLAVLLIAAIVIASTGDEPQKAAATPAPTAPVSAPVSPPPPTSASRPAEEVKFAPKASAADQRCASHGFGDVQASLQVTSCTTVRRASFGAVVDGRPAAATISVVEFAQPDQAAAFKSLADTPGSGGILDIATETGQWQGEVPVFENAAYSSSLEGSAVRLVQVVWLPGPSTPDDPGLVRAAKTALTLPLT
ncbi:hypothetical protein [Amycolatopsis sp.]|uniref:hypothetical protein n=1 Tax=Amycolatopsis sp. TaxID=37632 RepID=UPI002E03BD98|nr:hypothetical protein [Amycolatopsis sp.]